MDRAQRTTHQNSDMAAAAARQCLGRSTLDKDRVEMLAVGSTQGDLPLPGLASMVQAELRLPPCEILTAHGVCSAGMQALKGASAQIRVGDHANALVCASELASRLLKHSRYEEAFRGRADAGPDLESEFLRWMLSDGAGAMLLQDRPASPGLNLRIDWMEILSFAGDYPLCMSCGTAQDGSERKSWQDFPTYAEAERDGALLLRQDLKLLDKVVKIGLEGYLRLVQSGRIRSGEIDHFLCHYSSHYFRGRTLELMRLMGCLIPEERWFTNLYTKGNTGCASIFIMLEELLYGGTLVPGQTVFCFVPESGRFAAAYLKLTAVAGRGA
jgi:3-oxoacyl-[acyl-carrier-protein] synthase-3